jgi:glycosyltransferase involved in cell wall biosynthesis
MGKTGGFSAKATGRLAKEISRIRPAVVHTHNLGPLIYASLATAFGRRCALLHGEHSQLTPDEKRPRRLRQRRWLYHACRQVHTVSTGIYDELLALGFPANRLTVVANGVDAQRFHPGERHAAREALSLPPDDLVIGIIGRFGPHKRHELLIEAFEKAAGVNPGVRLLIVGGGGSEENRVAERVRRSAVAARIHFTGFRLDPAPCYRALDLLAIPSINEGMSNAALEAMACGVPALANAGCGHEQVITSGRDGVIADLGQPVSLAKELISLLARPALLMELGRRARQTVETRFSLEAMADAYEGLYRRAAAPASN